MTKSVFDMIGVDIKASPEDVVTKHTRGRPTPARSMALAAERNQHMSNTLQSIMDGGIPEIPVSIVEQLNNFTLRRIIEVYQRTNEISLVCMRCGRRHIKEEVGTTVVITPTGYLYGKMCHEKISKRMDLLKVRKHPDGTYVPLPESELKSYTCMTTDIEFKANPENIDACGSNCRSCYSCPHSDISCKHQPCPLEERLGLYVNNYKTAGKKKNF